MSAPLEVEPGASSAQPDAILEGVGKIEGRSLWQISWMRLKRDKVAIGGGVVVVLLILVAIFAPLLCKLVGVTPNDFHQDLVDPSRQVPLGRFGGISWDHPLGVEPLNGRDIFARIVYGARISLLIAFLATLLSVVIGVVMGIVAGYFGGWIDSLISRLMDIFLAFPLVLFALALVGAVPDTLLGLTGDALRVGLIVFIIGFFSWPYIGRIIRGQTLSLREREFVDAARSLGARRPYILFTELLPNLIAPILVYATLLIPTNVLFEAGLSYLGVGVPPPTATWGQMLSDAVTSGMYQNDLVLALAPGLALVITMLAFNLMGDCLRDALDPRAAR